MIAELAALLVRTDVQIAFAAVAAAGLVRGFSGFGAGMVWVPIAAALFGPEVAAGTILLFDLPVSLSMTVRLLPKARVREVIPLSIGNVIAVPAGALALTRLDPEPLRWAISLLVLAGVAAIASGARFRREPGRGVSIAVGAVSGFMNGLAQIGAPPLILYWLSRAMPAEAIRASAVLYFMIGTAVTMTTYVIGGVLTREVTMLALLLCPVYTAAIVAGSATFGIASERTYRRIAIAMIALSGLAGLPLWTG